MRCSLTKIELGYSELPESIGENDCGVRALEIAFDISYQEAFRFLAERGRVPGEGMPTYWLHSYERQIEPLFGFLIKPYRFGRRLRVKRRQKVFSEGRWLVLIPGHIFAIKDGTIFDTIDHAESLDGIVVSAWRVVPL